jgi:hypothetical protein
MMRLRPHHLLDIITQYGAGVPFRPHHYGHALHSVAETVIANPDLLVELVVDADDICAPCSHLVQGRCDDVLSRVEPPTAKQDYNDDLDHRLLAYLGITEGDVMSVRQYLKVVRCHLEGIEKICTHPREDEKSRLEDLTRGVAKLGA